MASFNQVTIVGNLCRDPELRNLNSGTAVCGFSVAVNETWKDKATGQKKESVTYVDCTAWGRTAEVLAEYAAKGSCVLVSGRLKQESWDDKQTGQKRTKLAVTADSIQLMGSKPNRDTQASETQESAHAPVHADFGGDSEIPF